jgi:multidrug efflux pump subunit AcrA (membrane-fusion protein)
MASLKEDGAFESRGFRKINRLVGAFGLLLVIAGLLLVRADQRLVGSGVVEDRTEHKFYAPRDVRIVERLYSDGDTVKEGDALLRFASSVLRERLNEVRQTVAQTEADFFLAEAALRDWERRPAEANWLTASQRDTLLAEIERSQQLLLERLNTLVESGGVTTIEVQNRRVQLLETQLRRIEVGYHSSAVESGLEEWNRELLEARLQAADLLREVSRKTLEALEADEAELVLKAPFDGRLVDWRPRQVGETYTDGEVIGTLVSSNGADSIKALLPERNIDLARSGQRVRIISGVYRPINEGYVWGQLVHIHPSDTTETSQPGNELPLYEAKIDIVDSPRPLPHGSSVQVEVIVGRRTFLEMLFLRRARATEQAD